MKSKQMIFFAILEDIELIIRDIEGLYNVHYYKTGMFENQAIPHYDSIFDTSNLGYALSGDWNKIDTYLVMPKENMVQIRDVPQKSGGVKFAVDQMINPQSVELKMGGIYKESEHVLIAGRIATIAEDEISTNIFKLFSSSIKRRFKKIGSFFVGEIAETKLRSGWRLVTNEKSPKEYDLAIK